MFDWLSLANTLSGNDCNLLSDKSPWKDEKNEVIDKKIDAKILKGDVFLNKKDLKDLIPWHYTIL